jgi:hypothetical protein
LRRNGLLQKPWHDIARPRRFPREACNNTRSLRKSNNHSNPEKPVVTWYLCRNQTITQRANENPAFNWPQRDEGENEKNLQAG